MSLEQQQKDAAKWVNDYSDMLYGFAVQRVNDTNSARDIVQDTFLAAWRNVDNYTGQASVKTWLFTILKNKIIDHYRKTSSRSARELSGDAEEQELFFDSEDHWATNAYPKDWGINYDNRVETKEFYSILQKCKSKLKDIQASVFSMKYLDGLESEEICKVLNITSSNYWVLVHRAKVQLRACLETNWFVR